MRTLAVLALLATAGCATTATPQRDFFTDLSSLCGKSFAGKITSPPAPADADFAGKAMVMHVRECSADTIRVPFHVADDHSRTWVITRIGTGRGTGLRLKHDHRHKDGSEDKVTQYGGDSVTPISAARQEFPADQFTKDLLIREGNTAGANNVWSLEVVPGRTFVYELRRPKRFFRVEFDLTKAVAAPPAPWGSGGPL